MTWRDRIWRATVGRLVAAGIRDWEATGRTVGAAQSVRVRDHLVPLCQTYTDAANLMSDTALPAFDLELVSSAHLSSSLETASPN